jgi:WD40 repeat protein
MSSSGCSLPAPQVTLVTGGTERHVTVWDLRAPDPVHVLYNAHEGDVGAVAVAPGGSVLATGGSVSQDHEQR